VGGAHPDPRGGSVATWPLLTSGISSDRRFMDISGNTTAAPALIAFSPTRLQLLATGTDGYLYDNQTQTTRVQPNPVLGNRPGLPEWGWRGFQPLTNVPVSLGSTAKIADREFAVAVKARDGRVMLNRFQGWRWSDFFAASTSAASSSQTPALTVH